MRIGIRSLSIKSPSVISCSKISTPDHINNNTELNSKLLETSKDIWNIKFDKTVYTHHMDFHFNDSSNAWLYRVLNENSEIIDTSQYNLTDSGINDLTMEKSRKIMKTMIEQQSFDKLMLDVQRTGAISFYMTAFGEEASIASSAAALTLDDTIFMQYREATALRYRGYTNSQMIAQCMGNSEDLAKGKQMPIHYGSKELNVQTVSSPLTTQLPHAAGAGYSKKLENMPLNIDQKSIVCCYFGEGAASEGDFHAGLNFAATLKSHTLYICRNNGYAISTHVRDQYVGDGIHNRGISYGIPSLRVDGTDPLAMYFATQAAKKLILQNNTPVLIEAMMYRISDHSTSDDSSRYRPKNEIKYFNDIFDPIKKFEKFLIKNNWWNEDETKEIIKKTRKETISELQRQKSVPLPGIETLFEDTYKDMTPDLIHQRKQLYEHYERNKVSYEQLREKNIIYLLI